MAAVPADPHGSSSYSSSMSSSSSSSPLLRQLFSLSCRANLVLSIVSSCQMPVSSLRRPLSSPIQKKDRNWSLDTVNREFQAYWITEMPWLAYDELTETAWCVPCKSQSAMGLGQGTDNFRTSRFLFESVTTWH